MGQAFSYRADGLPDRSHDDYYFHAPEEMTAADPAPPFIDLSRDRIVQRVIAAELLRRAFPASESPLQRTPDSIHGTFGPSAEWPSRRRHVQRWLTDAPEVDQVAATFTRSTHVNPDTLASWARSQLINEIDSAVGDPYFQHPELSEPSRQRRRAAHVRVPHPGPGPCTPAPSEVDRT